MRIEILVKDELMEQVKSSVACVIEPRDVKPDIVQLNTVASIKKMTFKGVTNEETVCRVADTTGAISACSF